MKKLGLRALLKMFVEAAFVATVCLTAAILIYPPEVMEWYKNAPFYLLILLWASVYILGDIMIHYWEEWMMKRKVKKLAKEVAKFHGLDPKDFDYDDFEITYDSEDKVLEVTLKKKDDE